MRLPKALFISVLASTTVVGAWDGPSYQEQDLYVRDPYPRAYADPEASYFNHYVFQRTPRDGPQIQERNINAREAYTFAYADAEVPYSRLPGRDLHTRDAGPSAFVDAEVSYSGRPRLPISPEDSRKLVDPVAPPLRKVKSSPSGLTKSGNLGNAVNPPLNGLTPNCRWTECSNHCWCDPTGKVQCYSMRVDAEYSVSANAFTISCREDCQCPN